MQFNNYDFACKQVLEYFKELNSEELNGIPKDVIKKIENNANNIKQEITIKYNKSGMPILSKEAQSIVVYLFKEYINKDIIVNEAIDNSINENVEINRIIKNKANHVEIKNDIFEE